MSVLNSETAAKLAAIAAQQKKSLTLQALFAQDSQRFNKFSLNVGKVLFDYSKQLITPLIRDTLLQLAQEAGLAQWIDKLFSTAAVNSSEQRAAMHWALRLPSGSQQPQAALVHEQLAKMQHLVELLHSGNFRGVTGEAITDVVNLGVGGSELGPLMVNFALSDYSAATKHPLRVHFASSMDGSQLAGLLTRLRPQTTAFIISSKSFTTVDTLSNATTAYNWLANSFGSAVNIKSCHFMAVSAKTDKMTAWGIAADKQLQLWDWVGGRFSLWSAIGLPIALHIGMDRFKQLLAGAHAMDCHFTQAPWQENLPVLMALIGIWNVNFLNINTLAILPYDGRLKYLTDYLQQLEMESNGKSVSRSGNYLAYLSCPIVWGNVGPNAQHAFYQLLHQGTQAVASDFLVAAMRYQNASESQEKATQQFLAQHKLALANCLAQSRLLAFGDEVAGVTAATPKHLRYKGNQPSSTIVIEELSPFNLGFLLACYEHKVFVQSVIWDINPFDQWGVEKGKQIAAELLPAISADNSQLSLDSSTSNLLKAIWQPK